MSATKPDFQPGCYIDGHHGHYTRVMAIEFAAHNGYVVDPFLAYVIAKYPAHWHEQDFPDEALFEEVDDVIDYLNDNFPHPDAEWGYNDSGDFGLWAADDE